MKKITKIFALLLCLCILCSLSACGLKSNQLYGKWYTILTFDKIPDFAEGFGLSEKDGVDLSALSMRVYIDLREDGTYETGMDEKDAQAMIESFRQPIRDLMIATYESYGMIGEEEIDEAMKLAGFGTLEEFVDSFLDELKNIPALDEVATSGIYEVKDGKICFAQDGDELSEEVFAIAENKAGGMTISTISGDWFFELNNLNAPDLFPLKFTK